MNFNTPFLVKDRLSTKKSTKPELNPRLNGLNKHLQNIPSNSCRIHFLLTVHGAFSAKYNMMGHRANLNKFLKIEIILNIFSDHNVIVLEINKKTNLKKLYNHMEIKQLMFE